MTEFPSVEDVAEELKRVDINHPLQHHDAGEYVDVRLQVYPDGDWAIRAGDPCYDRDHTGYWGCGTIAADMADCDYEETAKEMIAEAEDQYAQSGDDEPQIQEDDYQSSDDIHWYQYGKLVLTLSEDEDRNEALKAHMEKEQFWPNAWSISDHGNAHLIDLSE